MNYRQAREYIDSISIYGSVLGLEGIRELLKRLDNPQDKLQYVHVSGTNGKGSIVAYVSTTLIKAGYKVGTYISPAVNGYRERIQVNHEDIEKEAVASIITQIKEAADNMTAEGYAHPTPFEVETAMAFLYFVEKQCDIVVLEVGMGGTEDATNIIKAPLCACIASVSLDHVGILGNNLKEIAAQKAGIIKSGSVAVLYRQATPVMNVVKERCVSERVPLVISDFSDIRDVEVRYPKQSFSYKEINNIEIGLLGAHQLRNAATAIEVLFVLRDKGFCITRDIIKEGLKSTVWRGRLEQISNQPKIIIDGAHNEDAARALRDSIKEYFPGRKIIYIMGVLADKDYKKIIEITYGLAQEIITITPDNKRALDSAILYDTVREIVKEENIKVIDGKNVRNGLKVAMQDAKNDELIIAFGSLSYLGELRREVANGGQE